MNRYLLKSTIVAALGGLLFGFDTVVISGATSTLSEVYQLTPMLLGFTVASALLGTVLGSMFAGAPERSLRPPPMPAGPRGPLRHHRARLRARLELVRLRLVPLHRRTRHRRLLRDRPDVHRGDRAGRQDADGSSGSSSSTSSPEFCSPTCRTTSSAALGFGAEEWRWKLGVAVLPAVFFFCHAVRHSAEPALADPPRRDRRGPPRSSPASASPIPIAKSPTSCAP